MITIKKLEIKNDLFEYEIIDTVRDHSDVVGYITKLRNIKLIGEILSIHDIEEILIIVKNLTR